MLFDSPGLKIKTRMSGFWELNKGRNQEELRDQYASVTDFPLFYYSIPTLSCVLLAPRVIPPVFCQGERGAVTSDVEWEKGIYFSNSFQPVLLILVSQTHPHF